jgi:serine/threonine protein kinase
MGAPAQLIGRQVGRYTITSHLASGGMAELYIARQEAVGGFEKDLVLKMLQDHYAENPRVVQMFLDEARLAAKLNHQNIVHVYDVAEADGIRYIAMEYIHGETVTDIVRRSIARGGFIPVEHAVQIVADTASGLAYAHDRRDLEGRPVRIIHRDVSPSNILCSYEGQTKIVDFGIARVQDQIREESGMRPGKVSYMSPEQVRGEVVDHRSDIFSLGIILYEITVGRRLWRGPPEAVMRRIVEEQVPPPTYVRREYPPALELIVMKALEKRPVNRHQSAGELAHELRDFLEEAGLKSGTQRLARYMKELFAPDDGLSPEDLERARQFGDAPAHSELRDDADDSEELDFDRRAPLVMRVEARADEGGGGGRAAAAGLTRPSAPARASDDPFPPIPLSVPAAKRERSGPRGGSSATPPPLPLPPALVSGGNPAPAADAGRARVNGKPLAPVSPPAVPVEARLVRGPSPPGPPRATSAEVVAVEALEEPSRPERSAASAPAKVAQPARWVPPVISPAVRVGIGLLVVGFVVVVFLVLR